jgi:hypothetical protein
LHNATRGPEKRKKQKQEARFHGICFGDYKEGKNTEEGATCPLSSHYHLFSSVFRYPTMLCCIQDSTMF